MGNSCLKAETTREVAYVSITEETRRESYEKLDSNTLRMKIVSLLKEKDRAMSAGEIARIMYMKDYIPFPVRQAVAPRLTELEADGVVMVAGKVYDHETKRNVAAYRLVEE